MIQLATPVGVVLAQLFAQEDGAADSSGSALGLLPILVIGGAIFYLLFFLPQRRRRKQMNQLRDSIGVGDEVRTIGGIYGTVLEELGDAFVIDVGGGTTMRVNKRAVAEKLEDEAE